MSALIGLRIELRDAHGKLVGAVYCEDQFEAVAVPQRGDLVALAAITGLPAPDSSFAERDSLHGLADAFPFLTVHHLEHYPTADHQVGERPGCTVVLYGRAPSDNDGATALVQLFGPKAGQFHRLVPLRKLPSTRLRTHGWQRTSRRVSDWRPTVLTLWHKFA